MIEPNSVRKHGEGPFTIALLHGGPGAPGEMRPVAEFLSGRYGVLELLQTADSLEGQIAEVGKQIDAMGDPPMILVGFSWGAWLATLYTSRNPSKVRKLILISSGAFDAGYNVDLMEVRMSRLTGNEQDEMNALLKQLREGSASDVGVQRFIALITKADTYDLIPNSSPPIAFDAELHLKVWPEGDALRESGELVRSLDKIQCPVVVFHGDHDPHPIAGVEIPLSRHLDDFRLIRLEKCGHYPWREKWAREKFIDLLIEELLI